MKTIKRLAALLAAVLITLSGGMALAAQTETRVFDRANLFTPAEEQAITAAITIGALVSKPGVNCTIRVTITKPMDPMPRMSP